MTRIYISADLEGIAGVVSPRQCDPHPDRPSYDLAVQALHLEVNAVIETALDQGVSHILVNDSHCTMTNLTQSQLDPRVSLISGKPKRCAMMAGLDGSYDAAFFIGYHAKAGTHQGVLAHTFHHKLFDVSVNGLSLGEGAINALYASLEFGVPLVFASGDHAFVQEMKPMLPMLTTVETKVGITHTAAKNHPIQSVLDDYRVKVEQVLSNRPSWREQVLALPGPYTLRLTFINPLNADAANLLPGVKRIDGRTLEATLDSFVTLYQTMQSCYTILAFANYLES